MRRLKCFLLTLTSVALLSGCAFGSGGFVYTPEPDYEYSAKDIRYYTSANEKICYFRTSKYKRNYYKAYDGYCAVALANIGDYFGPVLVAEDETQVCYKTDYNSDVIRAAGSVEVNNKTYYYSRDTYFLYGNLDGKIDYGNYFSRYTTLAEVARDVASQAEFSPIPDSVKVDYLYDEESDGTLTIKAGPYFSIKRKVVIPSEINGKKVGAIAKDGFSGFTNLEELKIPAGIKSIGFNAFRGNSKLSRVYIPSTVTTIGASAFYNCSSDLYVFCGVVAAPSGYYTSYGYGNWYDGIKQRVFGVKNYGENNEYLYSELLDGTLIISDYLGTDSDLVIPSEIDGKTVSTIDSYCFSGEEQLRTVVIPDTIKTIGSYAFQGCVLIKELKITYGIETISSNAFRGCSQLRRVFIPFSVKTIGASAFYNCSSDLYVFCGVSENGIPSGYYTSYGNGNWYDGIKGRFFHSAGWLDYEDCVYNIDSSPRDSNAMNLTLVAYRLNQDGVLSLPESGYLYLNQKNYYIDSLGVALKGDKQVYSLNMPYSVTKLPNYAFDGCTNLEFAIDLNQTRIWWIGDYAFRNTKLHEMTLPKEMRNLGEGAFYGTTFTTLRYDGTIEDWNKANKSDGGIIEFILNQSWKKGSAITKVQCCDGSFNV